MSLPVASQRFTSSILSPVTKPKSPARRGKFKVAVELIHDHWEEWLPAFNQLVIIAVDYNEGFGRYAVFHAYSPHFDIVAEGCDAPFYSCDCHRVLNPAGTYGIQVVWTRE